MSLNQLVASDRLRPLLQGVVDALKPAAVSSTSETGSSAQLSIAPAIKVKAGLTGTESVRKIVDALIVDGGGAAAEPIADSVSIDGLGLYFVGAGSSRNDVIDFESNRTDAESPNLYLNSREGDDTITVKAAPAPPADSPAYATAPKVTVDAGEGNDKVRVTAGIIDQVDAGAGNDIVTTRADRTNLIDGGDGDDTISAFGRDIGDVVGGAGDDNIVAFGDIIGTVSGGSGNDQIVVGSRNVTFAEGLPKQSIPVVSGGTGDDVIAIAGKAIVSFAKGDGNDQVAIGDTTMFSFAGFEPGDLQVTSNDDGTITISGRAGEDGVSDSVTVESRTGTLQYVFDQDAGKVTFFTSDEAFAAANNTTPATLLADYSTLSVNVGSEDPSAEPLEVGVDNPKFLKLEGDVTLTQDSTVEEQGDGTLLTLAENTRQLKLKSDAGPVFIEAMSNRTLALFKTQEQLDAWNASPINPANQTASTDSLMAVLERINQRFV